MLRGEGVVSVGSRCDPADSASERARATTRAIHGGDTRAFEAFFRERFDDMYADARRFTGRDDAFCLDVVQNAMIRVIQRMKPLDSEEHLRRWLTATVRSCAFDGLRCESRRRRREVQSGRGGDPIETVELNERLNWLRGELALLERADANVMAMRYQFGWTLQRIGAALGLKPGNVDGRIRRIISRLRRRAEGDTP